MFRRKKDGIRTLEPDGPPNDFEVTS
jgi:hypothetical protein